MTIARGADLDRSASSAGRALRGCRRRCSSAARTSWRRSRTSWRPTLWSASRSPTSSRASGSPRCTAGSRGDIDKIVKSAGNVWAIGASITGPLFQGGRLYYGYKGSVVDWQAAMLAYEQTVLNALGDVSNALVARQKFAAAAVERKREVAALQEAVRLALVRYVGGFASYFEVLDSQQELFPAEILLARNELNRARFRRSALQGARRRMASGRSRASRRLCATPRGTRRGRSPTGASRPIRSSSSRRFLFRGERAGSHVNLSRILHGGA